MRQLRARFKALSAEAKAANQPFAVRVHRALSWLEKAGEPKELETRFIFAWIAFNALYGQAREGLPTARSLPDYGGGDRNEYIGFLNRLAGLDGDRLMQSATRIRPFLRELVGCKYLYFCYWRNMPDWPESLQRDITAFGKAMERRGVGRVYSLAFDRLYVMRLQLLHGGATFGSRVNRKTLQLCEVVLRHLMYGILEVMIERGSGTDWGEASYPPRDQPARDPERTVRDGA
jgi:hypothetical protein